MPRKSESEVSIEQSVGDVVECAVLQKCIYGDHNDIITLQQEHAEAAQLNGFVDTHPNAIKAIRDGK